MVWPQQQTWTLRPAQPLSLRGQCFPRLFSGWLLQQPPIHQRRRRSVPIDEGKPDERIFLWSQCSLQLTGGSRFSLCLFCTIASILITVPLYREACISANEPHSFPSSVKQGIKSLCPAKELAFPIHDIPPSHPLNVQRNIPILSRLRRCTILPYHQHRNNKHLPNPEYTGLDKLSRLIGAEITLILENGRNIWGVSMMSVLETGNTDILDIILRISLFSKECVPCGYEKKCICKNDAHAR